MEISPRRKLCAEALENRRMFSTTVVEREPTNTNHQADAVSFPADGVVQLVGKINVADDQDFYIFKSTADGMMKVTATFSDNAGNLEIEQYYGPDVLELEPHDGVSSGQFRAIKGAQYRVRLRGHNDATPDYSAKLELTPFTGDANNDNVVNMNDFTVVKGDFGKRGDNLYGDLNKDGRCDLNDFNRLKGDFGKRYDDDDDDLPGQGEDESSDDNDLRGELFTFDAQGMATLSGISAGHDDKDLFSFVAPGAGTISVIVTSPNNNMAALEVENAAGIEIFETEPNGGQNSGSFSVAANAGYRVRLRSKNLGDAAYVVNLKFTLGDGGNNGGGNNGEGNSGGGTVSTGDVTESEPNNDKSSAKAFGFDANNAAKLIGTLASEDDRDFFSFTATASGRIRATVNSTSGAVAALEVETALVDVFETEPNKGVNSGDFNVTAGTKYFFRLKNPSEEPAGYVVHLSFTPQASALDAAFASWA